MNVFTYGTLMYPQVWQVVVGHSVATVTAQLAGYRVLRLTGVVYPGMVSASGDHAACGLVYLGIDDDSLARLDWFEGDGYVREQVRVSCADGADRDAFTYVVRDEQRAQLTDEPWTAADFEARGDLERFVAGYEGFQRVRFDSQSGR
jgi:gamma-glutamylcyclotransferase (GGCT)/AIG2-like uncharacterized protein YtfP